MAVLQTQSVDISVLAGQTLSEQFDCYTDDTFSQAFDLTGYTLTAVLSPPTDNFSVAPITLSVGSGLVVSAGAGLISLEQDTTGWVVGRGRWYLEAVDASGLKSYPLRGVLYVGNP